MGTFEGTSRYRVLRQLGAGGMGVVYEALDEERNERVALKTLHEMEPDALFRFKREFRALHGIEHPNLVRLGELVEHRGIWFFTMELVDGEDFLTHVWTKDWRAIARAAVEATTVRGGKFVPIDAAGAGAFDVAYEEAKLRASLRQLAAGILAVHAAGKVHRDVKPSNVSVARDGRVVLLDFGLVTGMEHGDRSTVAGLCGTPQYMAPEQITVGRVGPAADWYALGVMLYEALTARLPIDGSPVEIMKNKLCVQPPPPSSLTAHVPRDLEALCLDLLRIDERARPEGREVLARLGGGAAPEIEASRERPSSAPFIGRRRELDVLQTAWDACRRDRSAATVLVDGPSGTGKSALLRAFVQRIEDEGPGTVVFQGRGYEHENIPYNVFDHVIDQLARFLRSLPADKAAELMPRDAWLLPRLFPVLGRVGPIAKLTRALRLELDAQELRTRCFAAFRELLARIAERRPTALVLDDLQWAGRDSVMLLGAIVRPPDPPPMLLVLSSRDARLDEAGFDLPDGAAHVAIGPLPKEDARALAAYLIDRARLDDLDAAAIADEAEGHPLFVQELVRYAGIAGARKSDRPRLDDAIRARAHAMDPAARELLELAVVAGGPVARDVLAGAARLDSQALARELEVLEKAHLVRSEAASVADAVEPFHNRVREATLAEIDPERVRACHARLAEAYERASRRDLVRLTRHLVGAGEKARGAETALAAADEAERALAFDRAAELYRLALDLRGDDREVRVGLARALANAGRSLEAADAYAAASASAQGDASADLRGLAARQYVRAGQFDRGMTMAREVLATMGVRVPDGPRAAALRVPWLRLLLWLRGARIRVRPAGEVRADALRRVDLLNELAIVATGADAILGTWFTARALLEAQRAGDATRLARALSMEAGWLAGSASGWTARIERLIATARAFDAKCGWIDCFAGVVDFAAGRYASGLGRLDAAYAKFGAEPGTQFEIAMVHAFTTLALYTMGRVAELRELASARLRAAIDAGDRYHVAFHRLGGCNVASWLAPDQPERAAEEVKAGLAAWSRARFDLIAFFAFTARVEIALYAGRPSEAWDEVERAWRPMSRAMLLFVGFLRVWAFDARGRAALACAIADPSRRSAMLGEAERAARAIDRARASTGPERARVIRAGIAALRGDDAGARRELEAAAAGFTALEMTLHAAAARRALGDVEGSDAAMRAQQIKRPDRWSAMLVPMPAK